MFGRLVIDNVNNSDIVREEYDTFICHERPPSVNGKYNGEKLQQPGVVTFLAKDREANGEQRSHRNLWNLSHQCMKGLGNFPIVTKEK